MILVEIIRRVWGRLLGEVRQAEAGQESMQAQWSLETVAAQQGKQDAANPGSG